LKQKWLGADQMAVGTTVKPSEVSEDRYWPPPQGEWTYDDYTRLPDNGMRYEVIEGDLYMSPAPRPKHQEVIVALLGHLLDYLKQKPIGKILISPIDVILPDLANPVQPDLIFISKERSHIVKEQFIEGVPDLIVEVLSPGNPAHDRRVKFRIYAQAGVREYWIIDPDARTVEINLLRGEAYASAGSFDADEQIRSEVLPDFSAHVSEICPV
jgi:Uma2 family endonuclease